ncbi:MAG: flippase [Gammaproteobacteria bacterium]
MISSWLIPCLPRFLRELLAERSYLQRVIDNTGWVFVERILRHTIGFLVGVWVARYVGLEQYGLINFAVAFVFVFASLSTLGLDGIAVRDIVRNSESRDETLGTLVLMRLVGAALMTLIVVAAVVVLKPADPRASPLIIVISLGQLLLAFDSLDCWFQANMSSRRTFVPRVIAVAVSAALRMALIVLHAPLIAFAWVITAETVVLAVGIVSVYRRSGQRLAALKPTFGRAKALLQEGWPLFLCALVVAVAQRIDQVMLGEMADYSEVGAYAVAVRIIEVTYIIPTVLATSIFPAMVKSRAADDGRYQTQVERLYGAALWLAVVIAIPLSLFAAPIVHVLVGGAYSTAALPLAVLAWMPVLAFFSVLRQRWLLAEHALPAALAVELAACVLNVLCNLALIPRFGATGAAISCLISSAGATLVTAPFSKNISRSLVMLLRGIFVPFRWLKH